MRALVTCSAAAAVLFALSCAARAQGLDWIAPPQCPQADEVRSRLEARARTLQLELAAERKVSVHITGSEGDYAAELHTAGEPGDPGTRRLADPNCSALTDALLVTILLTLPPLGAAPPPKPQPNPPQPEAPRLIPVEIPPSWRLGIAAVGDLGSLPELALGVAGVVSTDRHRYSLAADATLFYPTTTQAGMEAGYGGEFFLWVVGAEACLQPISGLRTCLGGEAGRLAASGSGVRDPKREVVTWVAGRVGLAYRLRLGRSWQAGVKFQGIAPLRRHRFVVQGVNLVHQANPVALRSQLALEWEFF